MSNKLAILENRGIDESIWSALGSSIFPGASDESMLMAFDYCAARKLDIMKKPCHIVPMNVKDSKTGKYVWRDVIMPGIADHRITANRTGEYAGQDAPEFGPMIEVKIGGETHKAPEFCVVTVYRMISGNRVPFSHTEYFEEACGTIKSGDLNSMWKKRKRGQLSKCAEAGALRKAFPEELGGLITADEEITDMRDAATKNKGIELREDYQAPSKEVATKVINEPSTKELYQEPSEESNDLTRAYVLDVEVSDAPEDSELKWTRYRVTLSYGDRQERATTFSTILGELAISQQEQWVMVKTEKTDKGIKLDKLELEKEVF